MVGGDIAVQILKEIRDEIRALRVDSNGRWNEVRDEIRAMRAETAERFGVAEAALHDLVDDNRLVIRQMRALSATEARLEPRVTALESRVDKPKPK
jgi:hypothetical protein